MKRAKLKYLKRGEVFRLEADGEEYVRKGGHNFQVTAHPVGVKMEVGKAIPTLHIDKDTEVFVR